MRINNGNGLPEHDFRHCIRKVFEKPTETICVPSAYCLYSRPASRVPVVNYVAQREVTGVTP